jgi:putative cell wall-binding protein
MHRLRLPRALAALGALALVALVVPASPAAAATTTRIGGADRFATAAMVSKAYFNPGVPVAFVADGDAFPDALSAGPAATALGGPVLLTHPGTLPADTTTELGRLHPQKIVVAGGTSAVSDNVKTALATYTNGQVVRVGGADRFETSAQLSAFAFPSGAGTGIIATGDDFPDALSGGSAAGPAAGPVLLVHRDSVPTAVANELSRLHNANGFTSIAVIGGTNAISEATYQAIANGGYAPSVQRRAGVDRFDTSVVVSKASYSTGAGTVFLASGVTFPDALAAIPPSGLKGFPILLTQPSCVPSEVLQEISRLGATNVVVLGGTAATGPGVASLSPC